MTVPCVLAMAVVWAAHPIVPQGFFAREIAASGSWDAPTGITFAPDGRMFVLEKRGRVYVVQNDFKLPEPFLEIEQEVLNNGDRGLLGIALDPSFAQNGYVYLLYTVDPNADGIDDDGPAFGRLTRYTASAADPNVADASSRRVLIGETFSTGIPSLYNTHTIGCLRFGLDGSLFLSTGDGAHAELADRGGLDPTGFGPDRLDPAEDIGAFRSQWIGSLAGKILRIDPATGAGLPSNPFYTGNALDNASRVWAYGLRNPFRFAVRPGTGGTDPPSPKPGSLVIGDVGWRTWEELDVCPQAGASFGWPCREGPEAQPEYSALVPAHNGCDSIGTLSNPSTASSPIVYWHHAVPSLASPPGAMGKASAGVTFYSGSEYPVQYRGACFFADYAQGWIRCARIDESSSLVDVSDFLTDGDGPVDIAADPGRGDLCFVSIVERKIWRIGYGSSGRAPIVRASADPVSGAPPLEVHFSSEGTIDPDGDPIHVLWLFGDGSWSTLASPSHVYATSGAYTATLTASDDRGAQSSATVSIDVAGPPGTNHAPEPTILEPLAESLYVPQADLELRASAADAEDPESRLDFEWEVILHHNSHIHPGWLTLHGAAVSFRPGDHDDGTGVWLEIVLRVTDTQGLTAIRKVAIFPDAQPIVIDNGDPGTSHSGSWLASGGSHPHGADSVYSKTAGSTYTYSVRLPAPGVYRVYAWWTVFSSRTNATPYTIRHANGSDTVLVNQLEHGEQWNDLGPYGFAGDASVTITAASGKLSTCADALLFLPAPGVNLPPVARIDGVSPSISHAGEPVLLAGHGEDEGAVTAYQWESSIDGIIAGEASFSTTHLSIGIHSITLRVKDDRGAWSGLATAEARVLAQQSEVELILDDGAPGTSFKGSWTSSGGASPYGATSLYSRNAGDFYLFAPAIPQGGDYEVFAWWTEFPSRSSAVKYTVTSAAGDSIVVVDQRSGGGGWNSLGTYSFGVGAKVRVASAGGGFTTCADAVKLTLRREGVPQALVDDGGPGTSAVGSWIRSGGALPYGGGSVYAKGAAGSYTFAFGVPRPGTYEVLAWWTSIDSRSTSAPYTVTHALGAAVSRVDQRANGGRWNTLGRFPFAANGSVRLDAAPDGKSYCADAIWVKWVSD